MNRWIFWLVVFTFVLFAAFTALGVGIVSLISPEVGIIVLSSLALGIFAFRLIANYVYIINVGDRFLEEGSVPTKGELARKTKKEEEQIKTLPLSVILGLIMELLEPYRYTFYFAFVLILTFALAIGLLPDYYTELKSYTEALFWGAALTTFIVWAFETFASSVIEDIAERELAEYNPTPAENAETKGTETPQEG